MKPFKNWENIQGATERPKLPMGGYICRILGAEVKNSYSGDEMLEVSFDISIGEHKDFYANEYRAQPKEDKKWKGSIRYFLPKEDGTEKDEWTKSRFKTFTNAVEDSNSGYHWDWNENGLKGKSIGMITRSEEWEYNGKTGFAVRPYILTSVERIEKDNYTLPDTKYLNGSASNENNNVNSTVDILDDGDLPFC